MINAQSKCTDSVIICVASSFRGTTGSQPTSPKGQAADHARQAKAAWIAPESHEALIQAVTARQPHRHQGAQEVRSDRFGLVRESAYCMCRRHLGWLRGHGANQRCSARTRAARCACTGA
eukprot:CAMPEP_0115759536 /NCGR_PEP_ID=MMETSP0272-20121206/99521_1 /TAXON_ID=71861 /ORGANISM="Scrippsiella trochoidea, Strain CCMP3099" /LENGTH=119 /DNA_ID=CAMNT_0003205147 /DNA_START=76 /DNA_END=436 /DNA_ORIENTATION=-